MSDVNGKFLAVVLESQGGGAFFVSPLEKVDNINMCVHVINVQCYQCPTQLRKCSSNVSTVISYRSVCACSIKNKSFCFWQGSHVLRIYIYNSSTVSYLTYTRAIL